LEGNSFLLFYISFVVEHLSIACAFFKNKKSDMPMLGLTEIVLPASCFLSSKYYYGKKQV